MKYKAGDRVVFLGGSHLVTKRGDLGTVNREEGRGYLVTRDESAGWIGQVHRYDTELAPYKGKVYLGGPMTGIPEFNFPAFKAATADLRGRGYEVVSPVEMDEEEGFKPSPTGDDQPIEEYASFLARDIQRIAKENIDAIVVLPDWDTSGGAHTEVAFVRALKKPVLRYMGEGEELLPLDAGEKMVRDLELREAQAYPYESVTNLTTKLPDHTRATIMAAGTTLKPTPAEVAELRVKFDTPHQQTNAARPTVIQQQHLNGNPKDALAVSENKVQLSLNEPAATEQIARVMEFGATKYGRRNFIQAPVRLTVYLDATLRHINALLRGEDEAEDSGQSHWAHIGANAEIVLAAEDAGTLIDDRVIPDQEAA